MQRDEKLFEPSVDAVTQRVQELRNSITSFIVKLEQEHPVISWPTVLDNFALLSGHISTLNRLLSSDKMPAFKNYAVIPLALSPGRDTELEKLTEGRVPCFNHEVAPSYLRTKPEPGVEDKMAQLITRSSQLSQDAFQRQSNALNRLTSSMLEIIRSSRETCESEMVRQMTMAQMSSQADTNALIAATVHGKGLKPSQPSTTPSSGLSPANLLDDQRMTIPSGPPAVPMKAPSTIKTNIKAASSSHPYSRP